MTTMSPITSALATTRDNSRPSGPSAFAQSRRGPVTEKGLAELLTAMEERARLPARGEDVAAALAPLVGGNSRVWTPVLRQKCRNLLVHIGSAAILPLLREVDRHQSAELQDEVEAILASAAERDPLAEQALAQIVGADGQGQGPQARAAAVAGLRRRPAMRLVLERCLADGAEGVREAASWSLVAIGSAASVPALRRALLHERHQVVRESLTEAIAELGG